MKLGRTGFMKSKMVKHNYTIYEEGGEQIAAAAAAARRRRRRSRRRKRRRRGSGSRKQQQHIFQCSSTSQRGYFPFLTSQIHSHFIILKEYVIIFTFYILENNCEQDLLCSYTNWKLRNLKFLKLKN